MQGLRALNKPLRGTGFSAALPHSVSRPSCLLIVAAKKGGGGGGDKKGGKKSAIAGLLKRKAEAESESAAPLKEGERATELQYSDPDVRGLLFSLVTSYHKATRKYLLENVDLDSLPAALYHAPYACLVHDPFVDAGEEPTYTYANRAALELLDTTWENLVGTPSRNAGDSTEEAKCLMDQAKLSAAGVARNHEGWQRSAQGRRFKAKGVTVFGIKDFGGTKIGQAAIFDTFELEDGTPGKCTGIDPVATALEEARAKLPPSPEEIEAAQKAADDQAVLVRNLKEVQGLKNTDQEVQDAVASLKQLRDAVEALKQRAAKALAEAEAAFPDDE